MLKYLSRNRRSSETHTNSHHDNADVRERMWRETPPRVKVTYNNDVDGENIFYIILLTFLFLRGILLNLNTT